MTDSKIIKPLGDGKRRILSLDEAMRQIDAHQPPKPQTPQNGEPAGTQPEVQLRTYLDMEWEQEVCTTYSDPDMAKYLFTYDESLARLKKAGYERHPSPQEVFSLIAAYHEGKLDLVLDSIARDILLTEEGIFSCHVGEREGSLLHIYEYVYFLKWDQEKNKYETPTGQIWWHDKKSFHIPDVFIMYASNRLGKVKAKLDEVNATNAKLVEYFYGRKFEDLPDAMKQASIFIPEFESFPRLWPIVCEGANVVIGIHPPPLTHERASLGVRQIK
jgi:hypothetical protein